MSNVRKTCPNCNAIYIGDGYKNSCTEDCHFRTIYRAKFNSKSKKKPIYKLTCEICRNFFESNKKSTLYCSYGCECEGDKKPKRNKIKEANERWLTDKPKPKLKSYRDVNGVIERSRLYEKNGWLKKYKACRG